MATTIASLSDFKAKAAKMLAENRASEQEIEGKSAQGVFKLTQAMGGGKTHNLLARGLLARHPELRGEVMGGFYRPGDIEPVRVVAFSGRESDAPLGIWGAIVRCGTTGVGPAT